MLQDLDGQILERRELKARRHSNNSTCIRIISDATTTKKHMATWDDLPPELVAKIYQMRFEGMVEDNRQRYVQRVVASF
jgi:hypothetical protein